MKKTILILSFLIILFFIFNTFIFTAEAVNIKRLQTIDVDLGESGELALATLAGRIVKAILSVTGSFTFIMIVYGGIVWLTSRGNQQGILKGKTIITWAIIGAGITLSSYILVTFLLLAYEGETTFGSAGGAPPQAPAVDTKCKSDGECITMRDGACVTFSDITECRTDFVNFGWDEYDPGTTDEFDGDICTTFCSKP